jgi:hypothetical protein
LGTLLAVYLLFAIRRAPLGVDNAATLGFFTSTFVILCISYGMWQSWWLSAIWLVSVFMVAARNDREEGASAAPANSRQVPVSPPIADRRL